MKLYQSDINADKHIYFKFKITTDDDYSLELESKAKVGYIDSFGIDDLADLLNIGSKPSIVRISDRYNLIVKNFNSLEELKKLVPEEFI